MAATSSGKDKILRWTRIIVGGYDLSGDARTFSTFENQFGAANVHGINEELVNYLSDGVREVGISGFRCLMNDTTNRSMDLLDTGDVANQISVLFGGGGEPAIPDPAYLLPSREMRIGTSFDASVGVLDTDFLFDSAQYDANSSNPLGVVLANQQYTTTTQSASHDNEAATTNGWHANLHVTATASGDYAFTIEHSTDDSGWATLGTFVADGSTVTSEHLSGSGTANQYVRFVATRTAGTATIVCTFARN